MYILHILLLYNIYAPVSQKNVYRAQRGVTLLLCVLFEVNVPS